MLRKLTPSLKLLAPSVSSVAGYSTSTENTNLKEVLGTKIEEHKKRVQNFRKQYGGAVIQKVTLDMVYGGMRSMKGLVCETSVLDSEDGIRIRGLTIEDCRQQLTKAPGGEEPLPEAMWWLLCTGDVPTPQQTKAVSDFFGEHADVPEHVVTLLNHFPSNLHPMSQFVSAIAALSTESKFAVAYQKGIHKSTYWEYIFEDSMRLLAKLPTVAAMIYQNTFKDSQSVGAVDPNRDWSANFASMLGFDDPMLVELLRLYLVIHSDHEGGNVSAHTCHLVGSSLSDPYLAYSAALSGLAGPLHGAANQQVLQFLNTVVSAVGFDYSQSQLREYIVNHLKSGQVVPGYGHAVLRKTDPRYMCQREFALKHLPKDPMFQLVSDLYHIVPEVLLEQGKAKNPWPNVDAHSGVLLQHYGLKEHNFYTVLFGVSRALGCCAQIIWDRGMDLPIERPKSHSTEGLINLAKTAMDSS